MNTADELQKVERCSGDEALCLRRRVAELEREVAVLRPRAEEHAFLLHEVKVRLDRVML